MSFNTIVQNSTALDRLINDSQKRGYLSTIELENIWIASSGKLWKYIWIRLADTSHPHEERKSFTLFFDRLDSAQNLTQNYSILPENEKNYVKFSIEANGQIQIWGMHLENNSRISLRGSRNEKWIRTSDFLLDFTMEFLRQRKLGNDFITGSIRKPYFAKLLTRHGFTPLQKDISVIIARESEVLEEIQKRKEEIFELENNLKELTQTEYSIETSQNVDIRSWWNNMSESGRIKGTLSLTNKSFIPFKLQISDLEDKIRLKQSQLLSIQENFEKWVPMVHWYGTRKEENGEFRIPNNIAGNSSFWFHCLSQENWEVPQELASQKVYIQTAYEYSDWSQQIDATRGAVLSAISKIFSS